MRRTIYRLKPGAGYCKHCGGLIHNYDKHKRRECYSCAGRRASRKQIKQQGVNHSAWRSQIQEQSARYPKHLKTLGPKSRYRRHRLRMYLTIGSACFPAFLAIRWWNLQTRQSNDHYHSNSSILSMLISYIWKYHRPPEGRTDCPDCGQETDRFRPDGGRLRCSTCARDRERARIARKHSKRGNTNCYGVGIRRQLLEHWSWSCAYCETDLRKHQIHIDHVIPLAKGGKHEPGNFAPACMRCNSILKRDMLPEDVFTAEQVSKFREKHKQWTMTRQI